VRRTKRLSIHRLPNAETDAFTTRSDEKPTSRSELGQIEHNVVQTFINFVTQLDASESLATTYLSRLEAYCADQLGHRDPSKTDTSNTTRPYATYIAWVVEKLEQEQNRCENLFASKTLRDGSVIEGKSGEMWALVHKAFQKDIVRESVLGMTQAGKIYLAFLSHSKRG
jgi:hypothetical protein